VLIVEKEVVHDFSTKILYASIHNNKSHSYILDLMIQIKQFVN
jgi:hypothetical protein